MEFQDAKYTNYSGKKKGLSTPILIAIAVAIGAVAIGLGVIIGWFSKPGTTCAQGPCLGNSVPASITSDGDPSIKDRFFNLVAANQIEENLRQYSSYPHLGGTNGSDRLADELLEAWEHQGLDKVEKVTYEVLMSYPTEGKPNYIALFNDTGSEVYRSADNEFIPGEDMTGVIQPYHSYAASGTVQGEMYYLNYARREDFEHIVSQNISLNGSIILCRYGRIFRGSKVLIAEEYGVTGVVMFTDPSDYAAEGTDEENVYPNTWWLPPTGVQRGTVFIENGDPLTPGLPATSKAYRLDEDGELGLPHIPSHPISYEDALPFLQNMGGEEVIDEWRGGLNVAYRYGPLNDGMSVELAVFNQNRLANISNVFGYIRGLVEPDRYVLIGNHRDAWAFGALDPTIGTSVMMEISRGFGQLVSEGWRPRRTIIFCSWGAEEFGLIGSYEFNEQASTKLGQRAVAYLNLDIPVQGNHSLDIGDLPLLDHIIFDVAQQVDGLRYYCDCADFLSCVTEFTPYRIETPNTPGKSLFDEWRETYPNPNFPDEPDLYNLGSGSDHAGFIIISGVPSASFVYMYDQNALNVIDYPVYHSGIETFRYYKSFIDPDFMYAQMMGRYVGEILRRLADDYVLPLDVDSYADKLIVYVDQFKNFYKDDLEGEGISLADLEEAVQNFKTSSGVFLSRVANVNRNNPVEVRTINDQLSQLETFFLDPMGLPDRPLYRHVVFAPSMADSYAGSVFPGLTDLLYKIDEAPNPPERWQLFRQHLATIIHLIDSASASLLPVEQL